MRRLLGGLVLALGGFLIFLSIGAFRAALREYEDTPDELMVGYGLLLLIAALASLWGAWRTLRR